MTDLRIREATRRIIQSLVSQDYVAIERDTKGIRLSAYQIRQAIEDYGRNLRMPPEEVFNSLDVIEVIGASSKTWSVRCDLWTKEEGRSDLSLEMTLIDEEERLRLEVDNIHVL